MADIFISYARADRDRIEKLATALEVEDYSVWWDRHIAGGEEFSDEIEKQLAAAKAVIVVWSAEAIKSRWVKDEAVAAADAGKLIPVTIDGIAAPMGFRQFHLIDLSAWGNKTDSTPFQDLSRALTSTLTGERPAAPAPTKTSWTDKFLKPVPLAAMGVAVVAVVGVLLWQGGNPSPSFEARPSGLAPQDEGGEISEVNTNPHPEVRAERASKDGDNAPPPEKSIAVLPFADMSAAGDQAYFADGIAEEILNLLAKSPELKVTGRTSSFQFKGRNEDLRVIGKALGVATILEGSLRKAGERVRITAQLIRTSDGFHLWSETYDGDLTDIFALQEEIATAIAAELRAPLGLDVGALAGERTQNLEAYEHYLAGMAQYAQRGDALIEAIENLRAAVALDPDFAAAWAGLANSYTVLPGWLSEYQGAPLDRFVISSEARYAALRAQELNPGLAQSLHAISNIHRADNQWQSAEKAIIRAYALAPNSTEILEDYYEFLSYTGQWEKGLPITEHMVEVDPLMPFNWINLAWARWDMRDLEGAAAAFEKSLELDNPLDNGAKEYVAFLLSQGDADAAASVLADNDWISSETRNCLALIIERYRVPASVAPPCGRSVSDPNWSIDIATFTLIMNGQEGLLNSYEIMLRDGRAGLLNTNSEAVASIRDSAQYKKLIRDAGFARYWRNTSWPTYCRPLPSKDDGDDDFECTSGTYSDG
ncbi:MAG: TIR domain-containing protein [Alphaproteobacteria bacterium]|nr:TIR domain-containing protein [Alphaproteobacteria bacterium]